MLTAFCNGCPIGIVSTNFETHSENAVRSFCLRVEFSQPCSWPRDCQYKGATEVPRFLGIPLRGTGNKQQPAHTGARRAGGRNKLNHGVPPGLSLRGPGSPGVEFARQPIFSPAESRPLSCPPPRVPTAFCGPGIWESWRFLLTDFGVGAEGFLRKHVMMMMHNVTSARNTRRELPRTRASSKHLAPMMMMMMSFICSCRNKNQPKTS